MRGNVRHILFKGAAQDIQLTSQQESSYNRREYNFKILKGMYCQLQILYPAKNIAQKRMQTKVVFRKKHTEFFFTDNSIAKEILKRLLYSEQMTPEEENLAINL